MAKTFTIYNVETNASNGYDKSGLAAKSQSHTIFVVTFQLHNILKIDKRHRMRNKICNNFAFYRDSIALHSAELGAKNSFQTAKYRSIAKGETGFGRSANRFRVILIVGAGTMQFIAVYLVLSSRFQVPFYSAAFFKTFKGKNNPVYIAYRKL